MGIMWVYLLILGLIGVEQASTAGPCAGYAIVLKKLQVCEDEKASIDTVDNFNVTLNEDCSIITSGCVSSGSFETAEMSYSVQFNGKKSRESAYQNKSLSGKRDVCEDLKNLTEEYKKTLQEMGMPTECPFSAYKYCGSNDQRIPNLSQFANFKTLLDMSANLGYMSGRVATVYDTGVGCIEFEGGIRKEGDNVGVSAKKAVGISFQDFINRAKLAYTLYKMKQG